MRLNRNIVEIKFYDFDLTHDELSNEIDLKPTHRWTKGDKYGYGPVEKRNELKRKETFWGYQFEKETTDFIGDQIKEFLIGVVVPRIEKIKELTDKYHGEFSVVQYMYEGCNPGLYFDKEQIDILHQCGLELNVDIYVLSDKGDSEQS